MKEFGRKLFGRRNPGDSKPRVIVFCCDWSSKGDADRVDTAQSKVNARMIRTMCSGKVDPSFIMKAFASGVDGVMLAMCTRGDCHFLGGNYQAMRRVQLLQNTLEQFGIEPERVQLEWVPKADGSSLQSTVNSFADSIASLGPV